MKTSKIIMLSIIAILALSVIVVASNSNKPEKITFIHYKDGSVRIDNKTSAAKTCYKLIGAQWQTTPVNYTINPDNPQSLSKSLITNSIFLSAEQWDDYTSKELFDNTYIIDYTAVYNDSEADGKNLYSFGLYPNSNVIAITNIWGHFSNNKRQPGQIVEYDILFNTYFAWGDASVTPGVIDLQNIATHETGHGIGLGDLYTAVCSQETMYGYSNYGETSKRTLNAGDIKGLQTLYGR